MRRLRFRTLTVATLLVAVVAGLVGATGPSTRVNAQITGQLTVSPGGPYSGTVGMPVSFTAQVGLGGRPPGTVVDVAWNFGDGATGSGMTASHAYASAGTFTVTVTASVGPGGAGGSAMGSTTATITAGGAPSGATEDVALFKGCNNVAATWPSGTAVSVMAAAINPAAGIIGIWRFDNAAQLFVGYSPLPGAPNDLVTLNRADPVFACMSGPGTLTRPLI